ncbi:MULTISPECIES: MerR family transcriptional regulator [Cytobacillus]|jgi:DNA-binding transcriptional MerR regulator|uniref:MerR family transcriptional regulator n=2 Tax=Cytobacillus oceanisediminis TaxID=665099 RepID=A0A160M864_9BACI|nr:MULTISPECIES: MerR family transcriptional regulator [Cytobacillus]EFV75474.1 TipAS antibiotic-recognition domain-containing protein [Bacillus sp. 2_A_57_CT2]MCS0824566.1 MerR family transcriptional regulator [Cytobacillus firmus]AND38453.1 MerR family transcriptional regulator [Cytobacillus oceanisediminis 2691]MBU8730155.1 MerR family transcriptional regulator [Cytobacillus oceanisediminis]MCM3241978.1 MerR family transcriptional regulator [Cytobacillus oceanisediminis]
MEYTVQKLAQMAGVSSRTLRYYDEIGILKPARTNSSGYRIYGQQEVDRLQQILFYRELGISLDQIKEIISAPAFDAADALKEHREKLLEKRKQLDLLITNVEKTIASAEGRTTMSDKEKFEGFKKKMIEDNEEQYGKEIREKYGDETVDKSNAKLMNMTQEEHEAVTKLAEEVNTALAEAMQTGDPAGELAQKAADLHKQWITFYWSEYSKEAHAGLAEMYVADERFKAYYDKIRPGAAEFLRDAINIYTGQQ